MLNKHDNINTGGKAKFRSELLRNNLAACLMHIVALIAFFVLAVILYFMTGMSSISLVAHAISALVFLVIPAIALYIYFGYRHLSPLSKLNFLSVLAPLAIFLMASTLALTELPAQLSGDSSMYDWQASPLSNIAAMINLSGNSIVMIPLIPLHETRNIPWVHSIVTFTAAFVPSLLMYLGIRLNIASQNKGLNEGE